MTVYTGWSFGIAWASVADAASPTYQDMTSRVDGAITITRGRTAEAADIQPGTLVVKLTNPDGALTAGNPLAAINVQLGVRCLLRDTVGGTPFDRFSGFLTDIDPDVWTDSGDAAVQFTFTDRLDRLQRSPKFRSTLTAQILGTTAASKLIGYWPLDDAGGAEAKMVKGTLGNIPLISAYKYGFGTSSYRSLEQRLGDWIRYQGTAGPDGEDDSFLTLDPYIESGSAQGIVFGNKSIDLTVSAQTITIVVWHYTAADYDQTLTNQWEFFSLTNSANSTKLNLLQAGGFTPIYGPQVSNSAGTSSATMGTTALSTGNSRSNWHMSTVQLTLPTGVLSTWRDLSYREDRTMSGAPPASMVFDTLRLATQMQGSVAHFQIYVGTAADFTYAMHCEQFRQGSLGLAGQTTGQRVATIAGYAGITRSDIDLGLSVMSKARLAGQTQADALGEPTETEWADLYARGDDYLVFRGRADRYTAGPKVTIQKAWIDDGLRPRVDGPVINSADVTVADGATAHAEDATRITQVGVQPGTADLHTASSTEADDRAVWLVYQYKDQRVRVPVLPIDLLHQTPTVRAQVMSLDIGDRADLAGMATSYPAGADKLFIEGYVEVIGDQARRIVFVTSPVLGRPVGTAERYFTVDNATFGVLDTSNKLAY